MKSPEKREKHSFKPNVLAKTKKRTAHEAQVTTHAARFLNCSSKELIILAFYQDFLLRECMANLQSSTKVLGTPGSDNWNMR